MKDSSAASAELKREQTMKRLMLGFALGAMTALSAPVARGDVPRPEHPRPQFVRTDWRTLNGDDWTFEFDFGESGRDPGRELFNSKGFERRIRVPFCPESKLSGVGYRDFIPAMWYHRKMAVPADWKGRRVVLHFGGVDYESEVYVDGVSAGCHFGGTVSFEMDVTRLVKAGSTHDLVVRVKDDTRGLSGQPRGKQQMMMFKSAGCSYTRTTGIWSSVWVEAVDRIGLRACRVTPDVAGGRFLFAPRFYATADGTTFRVRVGKDGRTFGEASCAAVDGAVVSVALSERRLWSPEDPFLYDVSYEIVGADGKVVDAVSAYAGLRSVTVRGGEILLNGRPLYTRFVLDQGFYPDGVWTAPTDADLKRDIELSMACGFNGARLHQKVFEERFHYWADRLGYLTWGESASWGADPADPKAARNMLAEWREIVERDANHPSLVAWTPFNETWNCPDPVAHHRAQVELYELTKSLDPTRPVNDASGHVHARTDIWSVHNYHRADKLGAELDQGPGKVWLDPAQRYFKFAAPYEGQPYLNDEFGGFKWIPKDRRAFADNTWGYGEDLKDEEEFYSFLKGEVDAMLAIPQLKGWCYTQLTDVEQEQNGLYNFDRTPKFDVKRLRAIFGAARK